MELSHNGLEFTVTREASITPDKHYETYSFTVPEGKAGSVTIRVTEYENHKFVWVWDIGLNKEVVELNKGYGTHFLYHALKKLEDFPGIENYKVKPNGVTANGRKFFESYGALPNINYTELVKKLEEKVKH
jgi:hypothetical protein